VIQFIRRVVRRVKRVCLSCGVVPVKGTPHCWECSLASIADFDDTSIEPVEIYVDGPVYFDDALDEPKIGSAASKF
jgi:hypothetical protein